MTPHDRFDKIAIFNIEKSQNDKTKFKNIINNFTKKCFKKKKKKLL